MATNSPPTNSQRLLSSVVTQVPIVLFALDKDGRFILSEGRSLEALGLQPGQVVGQSVFDVFAEVPQIVDEARRALKGETVDSITLVGDIVYEVRYTPVFDDNGNVETVTGVAHDITNLQEVRESLRLKDRAIEASSIGISIADMSQPDQPLIFVNQGFEDMTGYTVAETIGHNCRFLQGDDRDQEARRILKGAIRNGEETTVELRNYHKDGTMFWNELKISPIKDDSGTVTHYVGFQMDITRRKRFEERIHQFNADLLEANAALDTARRNAEDATQLKTDFLATMSHELRTPLNAIIGYTDILLAGMLGELTEDQRDYQKRIMRNAESLLSLINDLLDLSKIEAGRLDINNKPFTLRTWVEDIVMQIEGLAAEKGLAFNWSIDERLPRTLHGDEGRLRQIAINLLSNAIKFTSDGEVKLDLRKESNEVWKLIVRDTGVGIPPHMQETIFDEFRQVDGTSSREFGGTGLGLAIVRKLALRMGGNVRLRSTVGKGSTFSILLPLTAQDSHDLQPTAAVKEHMSADD
jgi:PAS domain S-box-containing protein